MGKYWRTRRHMHTGYPYSPMRVGGHVHVVKPKVRSEDANPFFIGLFLDPAHRTGPESRSSNALSHPSPSLKRLNFVRAYGTYYSTKIASIYGSSRKCLPVALRPGLQALEERISTAGSPLWWGLHLRSEQMLWALDSKVDGLCDLAQAWLWPKAALSEAHEERERTARHFSEARQAYLEKVEEALDFLRRQGVSGTAKYAVTAVMGRLDEAQHISLDSEAEMVVQRVSDAWASLASLPPINKLLENAQPSVEYARSRYLEAHHAVVASRAYDRALKSAARMLQRMQESPFFKSAAQRLYSFVSPYTDPTLNRITGSDRYRELVDHLKPVSEPASLDAPPQLSCVAF